MKRLSLLCAILVLLGAGAEARTRRHKRPHKKPAAERQAPTGTQPAAAPTVPSTAAEKDSTAAEETVEAPETEPSERVSSEPDSSVQPEPKKAPATRSRKRKPAALKPSLSEPAALGDPKGPSNVAPRTAGRGNAPAATRPAASRGASARPPRSEPRAEAAEEDARDLATAAGLSLLPGSPMALAAVLANAPADGFGLSDAVFYLDSKGAVKARRPILDSSLKPGDRLLYLGGRKIDGPADVASALRDWAPGTRLGAVISRAGVLQSMSTRLPGPETSRPRDASVLSPREIQLRDAHLAESSDPKRAEPLRASSFHIPAGERLWLRFPKGVPKSVRQGDILEAETTTPMATDSDLDFLALPPTSRLWGQVVSVKEDGPVQLVRLHFYKIRPAGGRTYPLSAILKDVAAEERLARVSEGGTLICAPAEDAQFLVGPDTHLEARLLRSLTLYEAEPFFQAGPGLWFKQSDRSKSEGLEVTHVIPQRAAEQAGLKPGDIVISVNGRLTSSLSFPESVGALYGAPGSQVQLRVRRAGQPHADVLTLVRGMRYQKGLGIRAKAGSGALTVTRVFPGSPADRAGLKEGDRLLKAGERELVSLSRDELTQVLAQSLTGDSVLTCETPGDKAPRKASIVQAVYGVKLAVKTELRDVPGITAQ